MVNGSLKTLIRNAYDILGFQLTGEPNLTVDKGGPKIHAASGDQRPSIMTNKASGKGRMKGTGKPIAILAGNLGNQLGRFVIDKTGLAGDYDWLLEWSLDPTADSTEPSLFTAEREQLGLRLTAQKGPRPMPVIDNASKPSEN